MGFDVVEFKMSFTTTSACTTEVANIPTQIPIYLINFILDLYMLFYFLYLKINYRFSSEYAIYLFKI